MIRCMLCLYLNIKLKIIIGRNLNSQKYTLYFSIRERLKDYYEQVVRIGHQIVTPTKPTEHQTDMNLVGNVDIASIVINFQNYMVLAQLRNMVKVNSR